MQFPIESLNLRMLNVGLAYHDGDWNWQGVNSPFTRIYYVTQGEAWLHLEERRVRLRPNHLYMIPAHTPHSYECKGVFVHYYLHVYEGFKNETNVIEMYDFPTEVEAEEGDMELMASMCRRHPEAKLPESDPKSYDNTTQFTDYMRRYHEMPLWQKMELRGMTLTLFSRFVHHAKPRLWTRNERMTKVLDHVNQHIYEDINAEALADVACVTKPYLARLFKREFGFSPLQYINLKKMERAQLLLLTEDLSVKEVAYKLGFSDISYFIRLFKRMTGATPQAYRRHT